MSQRKQTARKTTGKHVELTSILTRSSAVSKLAKRVRLASPTATATTSSAAVSKPAKRVRLASPTTTATTSSARTSGPRSESSPTKSIMPFLGIDVLSSPDPLKLPPTTSLPSTSLNGNDPPSASDPSTNGSTLTSGTSIGRQLGVGVLDKPISVYTRFATWLEDQKSVHDDVLLCAVERDGMQLLSLARATVMFDNALRGHIHPSVNGVANPLSEHARTLRVFAELLEFKISEGSLSEELEMAIFRDGEALLRLALCCLDFDQAIRGSGGAASVGS